MNEKVEVKNPIALAGLVILGAIAMVPVISSIAFLLLMYWVFIALKYYNWFALPLGAPVIHYWVAVGIGLLAKISYRFVVGFEDEDLKENSFKKILKRDFGIVLWLSICWAFGAFIVSRI